MKLSLVRPTTVSSSTYQQHRTACCALTHARQLLSGIVQGQRGFALCLLEALEVVAGWGVGFAWLACMYQEYIGDYRVCSSS